MIERVKNAVRRRFEAQVIQPRARQITFSEMVRKTDNFGDVTWRGLPIWQNPLDLWALQEAISEIRPVLLLETGSNRGGSAPFYADLFELMDKGRVISVDVTRLHDHTHPRAEFLIGSSTGDEVMARMSEAVAEADGPVMVVLDSDHAERHVAAELALYGPLVTPGSLMLVQDGSIDTLPDLAGARPGPLPAIQSFLAQNSGFTIDTKYDYRFVISHHPSGWLRRGFAEMAISDRAAARGQ